MGRVKKGGRKTSAGRSGPRAADEPAAPLVNKLVITNRNPTKCSVKLCTQLRKLFDPECMTHLKEKHPRFKDCLEMADHYMISHIIVISDSVMQVGVRPNGPTHTFKILEYEDNFKNFHSDFYRKAPFITFDGKSALKTAFERFGRAEPGFKRTLHFLFEDEKIFIRHYSIKERDSDDNFVVGLKEIGPRLTLQLVNTECGFYPGLKSGKARK